MKNELKTLYLKDKKLAIEVAKVLGYHITSKSTATINKAIKKGLDQIAKDMEQILKTVDTVDDAVKEKVNGLLPKDVDAAGRVIVNGIVAYRKSVKKYLDWKGEK